jgi:hypothetical protein
MDPSAREGERASLHRLAVRGVLCAALAFGARVEAEGPHPGDSPLHLVWSWPLTERDFDQDGAMKPTHRLRLEMVMMRGSGWTAERILEMTKRAAQILGQCGIQTTFAELYEFDGPDRYRYLDTPVSRELARRTRLARPAVFFVADTRNQPAFDAEAIGSANSQWRPEMTNTVWITAPARDRANVMAHELAHVLSNSGEHSATPGNLMREETAPQSVTLSAEQCRRIIENGAASGLLQPVKP